jgi:Ca-activated chloride channel family protein
MLHRWFAQPWAFWLLTLLPWLGMVAFFSLRRRRRALARLGSLLALQVLVSQRNGLRAVRALCLVGGLLFLIAGIAGPQWGRDWELTTKPGRDLVVVLDLSRSMLAEQPSRQERARRALADLLGNVRQAGGHRLALIVFAAKPRLVCPLTHDYDHFALVLSQQDAANVPAELRPTPQGPTSGTRIGAALLAAVEAHDPHKRGFQDILVVSDGDDPGGDGEWRVGLDEAHKNDIPVLTAGVGDPNSPSRIPDADGYYQHDGEVVWTRLEEKPLEEIARRTHGVYFPVRTEPFPLGQRFRSYVEQKLATDENEDALPVYRPRYPWFFGAALALFALLMAVGRTGGPGGSDPDREFGDEAEGPPPPVIVD